MMVDHQVKPVIGLKHTGGASALDMTFFKPADAGLILS